MSDKIEIVSEDGSHWLKKFEDLTPREMRVVYDERTKEFRSLQGQKDWIKNNPISVSVKSNNRTIIAETKTTDKPKAITKSKLLTMLKKEGITAKDLLKIADAKTLLEALSLCTITS